MDDIRQQLIELADEDYRNFHKKLIKLPEERVLGVRTPVLRDLAKKLIKDGREAGFIAELPHYYYDENQLHVMILSELKDYDRVIAETDRILPYVDNWATCDQLRPKCFKKNHDRLIKEVYRWLESEHLYTVRFGIGMLLAHYLGDDFKPEYMETVAGIKSEEYYIKMMIAWYFAEALAKQYDPAIAYIEDGRLDEWTHNKAIQKARESYRIPEDTKNYLKTLRR
ncbi:MAG: DNA alkylation repair protein [Ruminococcus sp.]|nr:DNA alkylation repair protein [Ruminococcus sp.]